MIHFHFIGESLFAFWAVEHSCLQNFPLEEGQLCGSEFWVAVGTDTFTLLHMFLYTCCAVDFIADITFDWIIDDVVGPGAIEAWMERFQCLELFELMSEALCNLSLLFKFTFDKILWLYHIFKKLFNLFFLVCGLSHLLSERFNELTTSREQMTETLTRVFTFHDHKPVE